MLGKIKSPEDVPNETQDTIRSVLEALRQNYDKDSYIIDVDAPEKTYWLGTESGLLDVFTSMGHALMEMTLVM